MMVLHVYDRLIFSSMTIMIGVGLLQTGLSNNRGALMYASLHFMFTETLACAIFTTFSKSVESARAQDKDFIILTHIGKPGLCVLWLCASVSSCKIFKCFPHEYEWFSSWRRATLVLLLPMVLGDNLNSIQIASFHTFWSLFIHTRHYHQENAITLVIWPLCNTIKADMLHYIISYISNFVACKSWPIGET